MSLYEEYQAQNEFENYDVFEGHREHWDEPPYTDYGDKHKEYADMG